MYNSISVPFNLQADCERHKVREHGHINVNLSAWCQPNMQPTTPHLVVWSYILTGSCRQGRCCYCCGWRHGLSLYWYTKKIHRAVKLLYAAVYAKQNILTQNLIGKNKQKIYPVCISKSESTIYYLQKQR